MTVRTYIELFEPPIRLTLEQSTGGYYSVLDQNGHLYFPPTFDLDLAVRFMRAMEAKRQAVLDEDSIEWWRCLRVFGDPWSVKAPALEETESKLGGTDGGSVSSNVLAFRRKAAG